MDQLLITGGGLIRCPRCTSHSGRTGLQCGRPALRVSTTQKCQFHGGRGSGPRTPEGRARIAAARTTYGCETKAARAERSAALARLSQLEDAARVLGMAEGPRIRGRKANGYIPVRTVEDIKRMMLGDLPHRNKGVVQAE